MVEKLQNKFSELQGRINIGNYLRGINLNKYFTYPGSLTIPPCVESVIWTIFQTILPINTDQVIIIQLNKSYYVILCAP